MMIKLPSYLCRAN